MTPEEVDVVIEKILQRRGRRRMLRVLKSCTWWNDPDIRFLSKAIVASLSGPWQKAYACKVLAVTRRRLLHAITGLPR